VLQSSRSGPLSEGAFGAAIEEGTAFQNSITLEEKYEWGRIAKLRGWHEGQ
jgi:hypothetical protein